MGATRAQLATLFELAERCSEAKLMEAALLAAERDHSGVAAITGQVGGASVGSVQLGSRPGRITMQDAMHGAVCANHMPQLEIASDGRCEEALPAPSGPQQDSHGAVCSSAPHLRDDIIRSQPEVCWKCWRLHTTMHAANHAPGAEGGAVQQGGAAAAQPLISSDGRYRHGQAPFGSAALLLPLH